jgi:ketosteroid isomerase-like protein
MAIEENRTNNESAIRELIGNFVKAIRATDLYGVMSVFAPEVVSFDLVRRCNTGEARRLGNAGKSFSSHIRM